MRQFLRNVINQGNIMSDTKIMKLPEVIKFTQLSRASIYRLIEKGDFPKQIKLAERSCGWLEFEIKEYLNVRINNR